MRNAWYGYVFLLIMAFCCIYRIGILQNTFAQGIAKTEETSGSGIDELKSQLKQMEELFLKQQEQIKQMAESASRQQEQIQVLKDRLEKVNTETTPITKAEVKEEVHHEVENYLATDEARKKMGLGLSTVTAAYTPDNEKYTLGFKTADERYSFNLGFRLQFRYTFEDNDEDFNGNDKNTLDVRRARLCFGGNVYSKDVRYYVELDADSFDVSLRDFYVYWTPAKELNVKIGYFKVPFNRQRLASSAKLLLLDRSIASELFDQDREDGIDVYGLPFDGRLEYHAAVFNGAGENANENIDNKLMYVLGVRYNPFGKYDYYDETDVAYSETPKATVGAAVVFNPKLQNKKLEDTDGVAGVVDFGVKYRGISWNSEYYVMSLDSKDNGSVESDGFFTQVGVFVIPKKLELAARYSMMDPNHDISNDIEREYTVGLNYYFRAHRSKIQTDFSHLVTDHEEGNEEQNRFGIQYQIIF